MISRRTISATVALLALGSACVDETLLVPTLARKDFGPTFGPIAPPEPSRYLVGFDGPAEIPPEVLAASGGQIIDSIPEFGVLVVEGATNPAALFAASPKYVESAFEASVAPIETNDLVPSEDAFAAAVPEALNTPWYASKVQWDMRAMKADEAWLITDGGAGINICIVDTGIDDQHQEFAGKIAMRANFVVGETREDDPNGHGSHVAGEAAARGVVVNGVAPRATILAARVLNAAGSGFEPAFVNGVRWCTDNGAHVINMSLGALRYLGLSNYNNSLITYGAAINYATSRGTVVVTSAGNSNLQLPNPGQISVPAQVPGAIMVGATGPLTKSTAPAPPNWDPFDPEQVWQGPDTKSFYSNFGTAVTVFAPGGRGAIPFTSPYFYVNRVAQGSPYDAIWSVCAGSSGNSGAINVGGVPSSIGPCAGQTNRYYAINGTSMAAPHVTGMAAVLYAELGGVRSPENRARVEQCIKSTTDNIGDPSIYGGGRVNVRNAVEAIRAGTC